MASGKPTDDWPVSIPAVPAVPAENARRGWRLEAAPQGHVLQVLAAPGAAGVADRLAGVTAAESWSEEPWAVRAAGPGQWYVVGSTLPSTAALAAAGAALGDDATLIDQSHGRVRLVLSGPGARARLATGTALDLSDRGFPVGASAETQFVHVAMHLTRTGPETWEILAPRSFARFLWDEIAH